MTGCAESCWAARASFSGNRPCPQRTRCEPVRSMSPFTSPTGCAILWACAAASGKNRWDCCVCIGGRKAVPFQDRDQFVLEQLNKHLSYRLAYEAKKGDSISSMRRDIMISSVSGMG